MFHVNILRKGITDGNRFKGNDGNGRSGNRLWGTASSFRRCHYTPDRQKLAALQGIELPYEGEQLNNALAVGEDCQSLNEFCSVLICR